MGTNRSGKNRYARIKRAKRNLDSRERAQKKPAKKSSAGKSTGKASGTPRARPKLAKT
jgi:hypothetical protein